MTDGLRASNDRATTADLSQLETQYESRR